MMNIQASRFYSGYGSNQAVSNFRGAHIKERFFGLPGLFGGNEEGSHGEDVKELYYYEDNTPTHSYMRASYKYPCNPFPYRKLVENNQRHARSSSVGEEYEVIDTDVFSNQDYFHVEAEYAKFAWNDIAIRITVQNLSDQEQDLMVVPLLFFRNTWSWGQVTDKPEIRYCQKAENSKWLEAHYKTGKVVYQKPWRLTFDPEESDDFRVILTENETNPKANDSSVHMEPLQAQIISMQPPYKDSISQYLCGKSSGQEREQLEAKTSGTKCGLQFIKRRMAASGGTYTIHLRLKQFSDIASEGNHSLYIDDILAQRREEANQFYNHIIPNGIDEESRNIARQALGTLLWNKQFYHFNYLKWNQSRARFVTRDTKPGQLQESLNNDWSHLQGARILVVPDKWEYPYFCSWDSAFHAVTMALVDCKFAKDIVRQLTDPDMMSATGQIPGCEFQFSDVNPPIYAWATWKVYLTEKESGLNGDRQFLEQMVWRLWRHFQWWRDNRKQSRHTKGEIRSGQLDAEKNLFFKGGFMGLDNISIVNRNHFTGDQVFIQQVDATAWMALFSLSLMKILVELGETGGENQHFRTMAKECTLLFIEIEKSLNMISDSRFLPSWDMDDYWYYDILRIELNETFKLELPLHIRSIAGMIPLLATEILAGKKDNRILGEIVSTIELVRGDSRYSLDDHIQISSPDSSTIRIELALVNSKKFASMMDRMLNEKEFLSAYGIRSLSKYHQNHPFSLDGQIENQYGNRMAIEISYEPGTTSSGVFGSRNSNWRGPIWVPINYMIIEMLRKRQQLEKLEKVRTRPMPTLSDQRQDYDGIAYILKKRLLGLFRCENGSLARICHSQNDNSVQFYEHNQDARDRLLFYEYFNAETGAGLGASHQSWTTLLANLILE